MIEKVSAKFIEALRSYVAIVSPTAHKPSADEMRDEVVRRGQLGEHYVGGLGFARAIDEPRPTDSREILFTKPIRYESDNNKSIVIKRPEEFNTEIDYNLGLLLK